MMNCGHSLLTSEYDVKIWSSKALSHFRSSLARIFSCSWLSVVIHALTGQSHDSLRHATHVMQINILVIDDVDYVD